MAGLAVLALLAERPPAAPNALGWAVILLILDRPDVVLSPAFQLTVSATTGLLLLAPPLAERWRGRWMPHGLGKAIAASVGAQIATLPWALPRFYLLSPLAPLPRRRGSSPSLAGRALITSLGWTGLALIAPDAAGVALPVLDLLSAPFGWPSRTPPEIWLPIPVLVSPVWAWLIAAGLAAILLLPLRRTLPVLAAGLGLLVMLAWNGEEHGAELAMLDVGQGDSILLRDGDRAILVDGVSSCLRCSAKACAIWMPSS